MKIAVDIGHNLPNNKGAKSIGDEDTMNKEIGERLAIRLKVSGYEVVMAAPAHAASVNDSLAQRAARANDAQADLFVSIHMNAGGGRGTEVWIGSERGKACRRKGRSQHIGARLQKQGRQAAGEGRKGLICAQAHEDDCNTGGGLFC
jgi:N-acetylmuramoyl-L-alanine amidase